MSLLPEVRLNLDRPTIQHIYELFLPIIPGGTLVMGLLSARPEWLVHLGAASGVGYYSRIAGIVFLAYVAGLMLFVLSIHVGGLLMGALNEIYSRSPKLRPVRINLSISQNRVWRTVADAFLGKQLAPTPPALSGSGLFTNSTQFQQPVPAAVLQYDQDWNDWYNLLQDYVLRGIPVLANEAFFLFTITQATGWAIIVVSANSHFGRHHPISLFIVALLVLLTALLPFLASYYYQRFDRLSALDFTARLLAEIRAREDAGRKAPGEPRPQ